MARVADVMTTEVRSVTTSDVVESLRDLVLDERIGMVPVLDGSGELVGVVTATDLVEEWAPGLGVTDVMTSEVRTVTPGVSLAEAAKQMLEHRVHHLVVTERGRMVGVVSSFDLIEALVRQVGRSDAGDASGHAQVGDHIVIRGHAVGDRERRGIITETRGADGGPPFRVQWLDDPHEEPHEVLFFPGNDAMVEHAGAAAAPGGER